MNKNYEKLLLALAFVALLAGLGIYFTTSGSSSLATNTISFSPDDNPYQSLPRPETQETDTVWPDAEEQAPGELFDVFTPPKIYLNRKGEFVFKAPIGPGKVPFGIYLASISRNPYRIQLEGYIEEDLNDASKSLLLLYNEETGQSVRARVGAEKAESAFKVLDFTITKERDEFSNIEKTATAKILDLRTGETKELVQSETLYEDELTIVIKSDEDPTVEKVLSEAGETFETPAGTYTLQEINLEESSITVKKHASDDRDPEVETLEDRSLAPTDTPDDSNTTDAEEIAGDLLDFNF